MRILPESVARKLPHFSQSWPESPTGIALASDGADLKLGNAKESACTNPAAEGNKMLGADFCSSSAIGRADRDQTSREIYEITFESAVSVVFAASIGNRSVPRGTFSAEENSSQLAVHCCRNLLFTNFWGCTK